MVTRWRRRRQVTGPIAREATYAAPDVTRPDGSDPTSPLAPALAQALPPLPALGIQVLADHSPRQGPGFLRLRRHRLSVTYPDGSVSAPFTYDDVDRQALDAVVLAVHYLDAQGRRWVHLRSALRPPVCLRRPESGSRPGEADTGRLWELPAGLIEPHERGPGGAAAAAARELEEELGYRVEAERFQPLGVSTFPSPGVIGERHHYLHVEVRPEARGQPSLDGSALEQGGLVASVPLDTALALCRAGAFEDAKTELGLRRLAERYA